MKADPMTQEKALERTRVAEQYAIRIIQQKDEKDRQTHLRVKEILQAV